jgi:PAS domain S-box-containing protein
LENLGNITIDDVLKKHFFKEFTTNQNGLRYGMNEINFAQQIKFMRDRLTELQQSISELPQSSQQRKNLEQTFQDLFTQLTTLGATHSTENPPQVNALQTKMPANRVLVAEQAGINQPIDHQASERQQTAAALAVSETKLNAILDSAVAAILRFRLLSNEEWEFEYRSSGCEVIFGYSAQELMLDQNLWVSHVHPEDFEAVILPVFEQLTTEKSASIEYRFLHKDGTLRWIAESLFSKRDAAANCWVVTVVSTDITDRKRVEQTLRQQTELLQTVLDHVPVMLALFDPQGEIEWTNREWTTILGWQLQDFKNCNPLEEMYPDPVDRQAVINFIQSATHHWGSFRPRVRAGHTIDTEWANMRLSDGRTLGIGRNVTERKQAEANLRQWAEREQALNRVIQSIHNSLDLTTIFTTAVSEIGALLQADIAGIMRYVPERKVWLNVASYYRNSDFPNITGIEILNHEKHLTARLQRFEIIRLNDNNASIDLSVEAIEQVERNSLNGAWLLIPLRVASNFWGSLSLVRSRVPSAWQETEADLARTIADQLAIAIQQSEFYIQIQRLNADLERQVKARTAQLQLAYDSEATLKRITDRVRDSLDEDQILQTAVHELAQSLGATCCNAALFDLEQGISIIRYEHTQMSAPDRGRTSHMAGFPELYHQLLQGQYFQFCSLLPHPARGRVAMLACPILDDQSVMGDLWIINQSYHAFSEPDIRLVQQVANQCAIALRQSRLYQTAQAQVKELEKLNRLKDDFLSTVSHELRSPMSSIKMAIQMLEVTLFTEENRQQNSDSLTLAPQTFQKVSRYFTILRDECQREINLINNLLDLSRLDAEIEPSTLSVIQLDTWLPEITKPFIEQAHNHQQQLKLHLEANLSLLTHPTYLERILTELIHNACKYTPPNETITVSVKKLTQEVTINQPNHNLLSGYSSRPRSNFIHSSPNQSIQALNSIGKADRANATAETQASLQKIPGLLPFLLISVRNSGVEIPESEYDRIFDKFYRIPNSDPWKYGGTGLGLALVKKLVEHLRGNITVSSGNQATTFAVQLPMHDSEQTVHPEKDSDLSN